MGQAKYNPTAIAAKKGELPSKKKNKMNKRDLYKFIESYVRTKILESENRR